MKNSHILDQQLATITDAVMRGDLLDQLATRVINPYIIMAVVLVALGFLLSLAHLPEVDTEAEEPSVGETNVNKSSIWHFPHMIIGAIALFFYVGVEVIAGDTIIRYGQSLNIDMSSAKYFTSLTMLGMIIGYVMGIILIPKALSQINALRISALLGIVFTIGAVFTPVATQITMPFRDLVTFDAVTLTIPVTVLFVALMGLANALVWPAMWPLALNGVGKFTKTASALLIMSVVGGALIPLVYGKLADIFTTQSAYWVCLPCYLMLLYYSLHGYRLKGR
jgi:fucose permease